MADADDITRNPNGSVTAMTWAEGGVATEPTLGDKNLGYVGGAAPTDAQWNWAQFAIMRWQRAIYQRYPDASRHLFGSWLSRNGQWSSSGVGPLEGFLSDSGLVNSIVADVWVDPASVDTGAVQVQVSVPKAGPHAFTDNSDVYVYVPNTMITPPTVTEPELTFVPVPNNDPAPATPAGTVLVWIVKTNAGMIVFSAEQIPKTPVMKDVVFELLTAAALKVEGTLQVDGSATIGDDGADVHVMNGNVTIGFDKTNTANLKGDVTIGTDDTNVHVMNGAVTLGFDKTNPSIFKGDVTGGTDNTNVHSFNGDLTANNALTVTGLTSLNGAATAGDGSQNVGLSALGIVQALLGVSSAGSGVEGQTDTGVAVLGVSSGTGAGVRGTGGPDATSEGGTFTSGDVGAAALVARTIAGATSLGTALNAISEGDGTGVTAKANGAGYALTAVADLGATPVRSSVRMAPQQTTPSTGAQGDQTFVSDRSVSGKQRVRASSLWESYHSTPKGRVDALSASVTGVQPVGNTGTIALVQIDAEEIGDVLVVVRVHFDHSTDTTVSAVRIMDATAATTINGGGVGVNIRANDIDSAATAGRGQTAMVSIKYTLPADGIRQFGVEIGSANGTTDYNDLTVNVVGVY